MSTLEPTIDSRLLLWQWHQSKLGVAQKTSTDYRSGVCLQPLSLRRASKQARREDERSPGQIRSDQSTTATTNLQRWLRSPMSSNRMWTSRVYPRLLARGHCWLFPQPDFILLVVHAPKCPHTPQVFENQRRYPIVSWSPDLLPTDRPAWSNRSGSQGRDKKRLQVRSVCDARFIPLNGSR